MIKLYKKVLSPLIGNRCVYTPTCSEYAITAIGEKGFVMGLFKTIWRILRCNPYSRGGYDPVTPVIKGDSE